MLRVPGIPFLPGTQFQDITRINFMKTQHFHNVDGIGMLSVRDTEKEKCIVSDLCPPSELPSFAPPTSQAKLVPWLAYDKQVLCFDAYFKETLQEVYHAPYLVRKVKIYYYLADGTIQINEPKVENSGIPQGCLVHKMRIPKPPPHQDEFISMLDLNVDTDIKIFDRVFHITGCDRFTRHFLIKSGITVPDQVEPPLDPEMEYKKKTGVKYKAPSSKKHLFAQFLQFDRKVLKFQGYWDDRSEYGDVRNLEILYYLSDDTMDIRENHCPNSGRSGPRTFLKRGKVPKDWQELKVPGDEMDQTLLNVLGGGLRTGRYVVDVLGTGRKFCEYYTDKDLRIGAVINIYGRRVVITNCDNYTMQHLRKKFGIEEFCPLPHPTHYEVTTPQKLRERQLPPYNGWGSYEDSEGNCISVEPKPPQTDFKKFITLDKFILRFGAKLISTIRENCERVFIISYFLSDDTIQVYEVVRRNSGFSGGVFLKRQRVLLPNQEKFPVKRPDFYKPQHFYIGATINLYDHIFTFVSADEYTLLYMESHPFEFPLASMNAIMNKIRKALENNYKNFIAKAVENIENEPKCITYETFKKYIIELLGKDITDHEIITLCRFYSAAKDVPTSCDRDTVRAAIQSEIKRNLWNDFDGLQEHLSHINPCQQAFLSEEKLRCLIKGCRLPFPDALIDDLFLVLNRNNSAEFEVCDFMSFVDTNCGTSADLVPMNYAFELCPKIPFLHKGHMVDWNCFIQNLRLEDDLIKESE